MEIAKYTIFNELCSLESNLFTNFYSAFNECNENEYEEVINEFKKIYNFIEKKYGEKDILTHLFEGAYLGFNEKLKEYLEGKTTAPSDFKAEHSINYFTLGTMLSIVSANRCESFEVIHDETDQFTKSFKELVDKFNKIYEDRNEPIIKKFEFCNSKGMLELQLSDLLAGITYFVFNNFYKYNTHNYDENDKEYLVYKKAEDFIINNTKLLKTAHFIVADDFGEKLLEKYKK